MNNSDHTSASNQSQPTAKPMIRERRDTFHRLHQEGCFILPNPWNIGTAKWLAQAGFKALATTSSGYAFSRGCADGDIKVDEMLQHIREIVDATPLPVNVDFEDGHAKDLENLANNVLRCVETGAAGLSIEDSTGDPEQPLYPLDEAAERMETARKAIDDSGQNVMLIGRAECFLTGYPDPLNESLHRLKAYDEAGADCLYAPGLSTREQITAVVNAAAPKPVNVMMGPAKQFNLNELAEMGVRRISTGGALSLSAWTGFANAVKSLAEGTFSAFNDLVSHKELTKLFNG
jgi:2-methylisocitrate lyase-like PEP mutase family enzyme